MKKAIAILLLGISACGFSQESKLEVSGLRLENVKYPFPVKEITLSVQGQSLKMAYMDVQSQTPNGKTVLLLHGKNFAGYYWEQTANDLNKAGYRVVMPDQIGFGKSDKPINIQYSFQLLAQNTKAILDELKIDKVAVLGHSMGGMLATRFALMYPEHTEKLILENPLGLEDWKTLVPYQSVDELYKGELRQNYQSLKEYQLKSYFDNKWKPEYDKGVNILAGWTLNKEYPVIAKNAALTSDMIFTQPVVYEFENIKVPTLLIIGQRDRTAIGKEKAAEDVKPLLGNYPKLGRETQQKIKGSKLVEIDGVGHLPHMEAYGKFIGPLLDFLNQ
jgi:pimeloyl-ACP methyl ester carboxylesterase